MLNDNFEKLKDNITTVFEKVDMITFWNNKEGLESNKKVDNYIEIMNHLLSSVNSILSETYNELWPENNVIKFRSSGSK